MRKLVYIFLSVVCLMVSISFVGCGKTCSIPDGYYWFALDHTTFEYTDTDIKNSHGWVIDGDTAEQWTSNVCEYKAKIIEKDGEILFDGYTWRDIADLFLGDTDERGSERDYTVVYDEETKRITLTPKLAQENTEYVFDGITFEKSRGLKIEDLSRYIPTMQAEEVKTVNDFEKLLLDNLDKYKLTVFTENGYKNVYLAPIFHSITVKTDDTLLLTVKEGEEYMQEEVSYWRTTNGEQWHYVTDDLSFHWDCASTFRYRISFPMEDNTKYFKVVYCYRVK